MLSGSLERIYSAVRVPVQARVERQALLQLWSAAAVKIGTPPQAGFNWLVANGYAESFRRGAFWRLTDRGRSAAKELSRAGWR